MGETPLYGLCFFPPLAGGVEAVLRAEKEEEQY